MNNSKFKGLGVAMVTPFTSNGAIDVLALEKLTQFLIDGGVDYLVVQGTTGESPALSIKEKQLTLDTVANTNAGRLPIVFGMGGNNTAQLISDLEKFDLTHVSAILSASPYYNKPTQEGIFQHYKAFAIATNLPIILYNVPGRTASNILPETTIRIAQECNNVIAIKEACGSIEQIMEIIANKPKNFLVISGDDGITMPIIAAGGDGVISVVGNAFPTEFKRMVKAGLEDLMGVARSAHYKVAPIVPALFAEGNPAGVKEVLNYLGIMEPHVRLPLVNVSEGLKKELIELTETIKTP